jgi:hypothetical protein
MKSFKESEITKEKNIKNFKKKPLNLNSFLPIEEDKKNQ